MDQVEGVLVQLLKVEDYLDGAVPELDRVVCVGLVLTSLTLWVDVYRAEPLIIEKLLQKFVKRHLKDLMRRGMFFNH